MEKWTDIPMNRYSKDEMISLRALVFSQKLYKIFRTRETDDYPMSRHYAIKTSIKNLLNQTSFHKDSKTQGDQTSPQFTSKIFLSRLT